MDRRPQERPQLLVRDQIQITPQRAGDLSVHVEPQTTVRTGLAAVLTWAQAAAQGVHRRQSGRFPVRVAHRHVLSSEWKRQPVLQRKAGRRFASHQHRLGHQHPTARAGNGLMATCPSATCIFTSGRSMNTARLARRRVR